MTTRPEVNDDFVDMLSALARHEVDYVVVGAYAVAAHGFPRATGDLDILLRPTSDNAAKVHSALLEFGAPLNAHGVSPDDFAREETVYQIGVAPRRIDLLTSITAVPYDNAVANTLEGVIGPCAVRFIGRKALIANKKATGRTKDLADVEVLERATLDPAP